MISIYIDTTQKELNIFLVKDNIIISEKRIISNNDHSSFLILNIKEMLEKSNIDIKELTKIFVAVGPGSFTGCRIGITVAKILSYSLNIKVVPVSSLKQYIFAYRDYDFYIPIIEDNKGLYYCIYDKKYNNYTNEKYILKKDFNEITKNIHGKFLFISDNKINNYDFKNKKIDIINLLNYYKDEEGIDSYFLKPNYIKKIEVESKL